MHTSIDSASLFELAGAPYVSWEHKEHLIPLMALSTLSSSLFFFLYYFFCWSLPVCLCFSPSSTPLLSPHPVPFFLVSVSSSPPSPISLLSSISHAFSLFRAPTALLNAPLLSVQVRWLLTAVYYRSPPSHPFTAVADIWDMNIHAVLHVLCILRALSSYYTFPLFLSIFAMSVWETGIVVWAL